MDRGLKMDEFAPLLLVGAALFCAMSMFPGAPVEACERVDRPSYREQMTGGALLLPLDHAVACRGGCEYLPRGFDAPVGTAWYLATGRACSEERPTPKARRCLGTYGEINGELVCLGGKGWKVVEGSKP